MSGVSIIGSGNRAGAIGALAVKGGNTVEIIGRDRAKAAALASALKDLEREKSTLKRLLGEAELENAALEEIARGNF
jgi:predicted dinucleotide-binding enzyme